jgi:TRAP-type mannitol/chloroaromatic compound transport system permease small subunit
MGWLYALAAPQITVVILAVILGVDIVVWFSTKQLQRLEEKTESRMIERMLNILGSWTSFILMGTVTVGVAWWDFSTHASETSLDLSISIWTMLLDVIVIIGANYTRQRDRKLMEEIHRLLKERKDIDSN